MAPGDAGRSESLEARAGRRKSALVVCTIISPPIPTTTTADLTRHDSLRFQVPDAHHLLKISFASEFAEAKQSQKDLELVIPQPVRVSAKTVVQPCFFDYGLKEITLLFSQLLLVLLKRVSGSWLMQGGSLSKAYLGHTCMAIASLLPGYLKYNPMASQALAMPQDQLLELRLDFGSQEIPSPRTRLLGRDFGGIIDMTGGFLEVASQDPDATLLPIPGCCAAVQADCS